MQEEIDSENQKETSIFNDVKTLGRIKKFKNVI